MATKKETNRKAESKTVAPSAKANNHQKMRSGVIMAIIIIIVFASALLAAMYMLSNHSSRTTTFASFQRSFYAAPRVSIYVNDMNESTYQYTLGCATALIEAIVANKQDHRNSSTINFYIVNGTKCIAPNGALGKSNGTINTSSSICLSKIDQQPSIFINYSKTNSTIISGTTFYTSGDLKFLRECGIASELG